MWHIRLPVPCMSVESVFAINGVNIFKESIRRIHAPNERSGFLEWKPGGSERSMVLAEIVLQTARRRIGRKRSARQLVRRTYIQET